MNPEDVIGEASERKNVVCSDIEFEVKIIS